MGGRALTLDRLNVIGWQHASLAGALHSAVHPALVDGLHVDDDITVLEGHLVVVGSRIVIQSTHSLLEWEKTAAKSS